MKHIAIKPLSFDDGLNLYHIKRDLLLFDEISLDPIVFEVFLKRLFYIKYFLDGKKGQQIFNYYNANYEYLIKEKLITFTSPVNLVKYFNDETDPVKIQLIQKYSKGVKLFNSEVEQLDDRIQNIDKIILDFKNRIEEFVGNDGKLFVLGENEIPIKTFSNEIEMEGAEPLDENLNNFFEVIHQLRIAYSENIYDEDSISTSVRNNKNKRSFQFSPSAETVMNVILKKIPIPSDLISFEQILDFRKDPDTTFKFLKFRGFVKDLTKPNINHKEILEQLEFAIHEYEQHLKFHKLKYSTTAIELFINIPFEFLENLIKLKWKDLAKSLFNIQRNKIEFAEQEMKLKGSEVSYLHEIKNRFDTNSDIEKSEQMIKIQRLR